MKSAEPPAENQPNEGDTIYGDKVRGNKIKTQINAQEFYQTVIQEAGRPGASAVELRKAYLGWLSLGAKELPLFAGDKGETPELSSIYTALLTQTPENNEAQFGPVGTAEHTITGRDGPRQSALEVLDTEQFVVLMGGPGSGKSTFLNFVALCMAGESLGLPTSTANLELLCSPIPPEPGDRAEKPKPQRWSHKALLPVRVVLRDFATDPSLSGDHAPVDLLWIFIVKQLPDFLKDYATVLKAELLSTGGLILLDGLDEVPDANQRRDQVKKAVEGLVALYGKCRFLVTSRTYAYQRPEWKLRGFAERELLPFTGGQIDRFIDGWYAHMAHLFRLKEDDAKARSELLKRATRRTELRDMATRPLLLTLMARLQTKSGGSLPENREALYAQSVEMLLDEWEGFKLRRDATGRPIRVEEPSLGEWLKISREKIREQLDSLAYDAHLHQPKLVGTADIQETVVTSLLMKASTDPEVKPRRLVEFLRDRAGLLTPHGEGLYQFPHRSFQEYLAACHLARFDFPDTLSRLVKTDPNRWREVALLTAARSKGTPSAVWELVEELCAKDEAPANESTGPTEDVQWGSLLAAQVLHETGLAAQNPDLQERHERKRTRVRNWQVRLLRSAVLPARERALAGDLLAELGDTRQHLLDVEHLRFALVPRGPFWMGESGDSDAELHLNDTLDYDYWIAQTPITVAQFRQFVTATGYSAHDPNSLRYPDNRPATYMSWHDAQAYCAWLNEHLRKRLPEGWSMGMPSEAEWEKAARGGVRIPVTVQVATADLGFAPIECELRENPMPQRAYSWGDDFSAENANTEVNVGATSTPGCFEQGRGPYDCEDLIGNVWEWTRSLWGKDWSNPEFAYPYNSKDLTREDPKARDNVLPVVRGGSWFNRHDLARCASRYGLFRTPAPITSVSG